MKRNKVLGGLSGLCIGDALGVPFESCSRDELKRNPVTTMVGYGVYNQLVGTWSDDSSLTFCLADTLCQGFNLDDIARKFCKWLYEGYWTPYGKAFGVGNTTRQAIFRLRKGVNPEEAGGKSEYDNGNGSLMRILPLAYYLQNAEASKKFEIIHQVSSITHAHPRSQMACGIYIQLAINLLKGDKPKLAYQRMKATIVDFYRKEPYCVEVNNFARILQADISKLTEDEIKSSGYVIDTLEASLWCLLNNNSYAETVLNAVNLGGDTDTTGAVTGGLAGIYYGYENIPKDWVEQIARKKDIMELANKLNKQIYGV